MNAEKIGMCKHFHFWTGGLLFLQCCARVYKMKTYGGIISLHVSSLRLQLHFNESVYGWSKRNINEGI